MRWAVVLLLLPVLAGCIDRDGPAPEQDATGRVVDAAGVPVPDAVVVLLGDAERRTRTDADGRFAFRDVPAGPCTVEVEAPDFLAKRGTLTCPFTDTTFRLTPRAEASPPSGVGPDGTPPPVDPGLPSHELLGRVLDAATGAPVRDALWVLERGDATLADGRTDATGRFSARLTPGPVAVTVEAPCRPLLRHDVELQGDLDLDLHLGAAEAGLRALGQPGVAAASGPGPGMVTVAWGAVEGAVRYEVEDGEGGSVLDVGGTRAWSDHTPGQHRVRAVDGCGTVGPWSEPLRGAPAPGDDPPSLASVRPANPTVQTRDYDVLDANGTVVGQKSWRIVSGTGNCCENYVSTTRDGWVLDFGGESLLFSRDEGVTWKEVVPHSFQVCGEGAVVPGPGGDVYAMNWQMCLGAGDDGVWTLKYVAADDVWLEGAGPVHAPFFDRPWMTVMPGPHVDALGRTSAVRSYIFTNFNDNLYGQGHVVSGDGVTYLPQPPLADQFAGERIDLPASLSPDPDADWTQPIVQSFARGLDPGLGVLQVGLSCQLLDTSDGRGCSSQALPVRSMQRDGTGRLHAVEFVGSTFVYRTSDDVGRTWTKTGFPLPPGVSGILEWDLKAHHGLDRAVLAVHAAADGGAVDYAIVLRDIRDTPAIDRVLRVGASAGTGDSGVAAEGDRYDFMTTGFLPDGRVVLSMTDGEFHPPAVAIELK